MHNFIILCTSPLMRVSSHKLTRNSSKRQIFAIGKKGKISKRVGKEWRDFAAGKGRLGERPSQRFTPLRKRVLLSGKRKVLAGADTWTGSGR